MKGYILTAQVYVTEIFPKEQRGLVSAIGGVFWSITMVLLAPI
jgi:MFS family permease